MKVAVKVACLIALLWSGCYSREVADTKGDDDTGLVYLERWIATDDATGRELGRGCGFRTQPFRFSAELGQVVLIRTVQEYFIVPLSDRDAVLQQPELWCGKQGARPSGWVPDPAHLLKPPIANSCVDRQAARLLSAEFVPPDASSGDAEGYRARFEILGKGYFCHACIGDPYKACNLLSVE